MTPSPRRALQGLALAAVTALGAAPARAQSDPYRDPTARPTRGVYVTEGVRAGEADAAAVELNPAQLGLLTATRLALVAGAWRDSVPLPGRGGGLLVGTPIFLSSALGFGLSHVGVSPLVGVESHTKLQVAYALRVSRGAALGASWAHLWGSRFRGTDTFDLGLSLRLGRSLALGFVVEDVGQPTPGGVAAGAPAPSLPRLWAAELALRPLGTERLELAVGATHVEDDRWRALAARARLSALLLDGLRVYADADTVPSGGQLAFSDGASYRLSVGLAWDFAHAGGAVATRFGIPGAGGSGAGTAALLRLEGERRVPLIARAFVARVSLDGIGDERGYLALVRRLRGLAADPGAVGVLLKIEHLELGLGRIEELRDLVAALRAQGKRVFAYAPFPSTREYYLAVACDAIILHPAGELMLTGFSQTVTFYKKAMELVGVNVDLVRIGEFKGAMEPFIMSEQSTPVRRNKNELLDVVFKRVTAAVSAGRSRPDRVLDEPRVRELIDLGLFTPAEAQRVGLVDAAKDEGQIQDYLRQVTGRPGLVVGDVDPSPLHPTGWPGRRVAVVLADGGIVDGPSQRLPFDLGSVAGSDTLVAALDECHRDPTIAAVVLRVNSPGGSAFASDVIARAIQQVRRGGKPVVVSMGDVAASGGYYIAAPGDIIFADALTITGSIGIFGYKTDVRKLMGTLGVSAETYRRGRHADYLSPYRPWTDDEVKLATDKIKHFYGLFLNTVAEGRRARGLTVERVDEIGRGHVWTGTEALELGLVDRVGGVIASIDEATRRGGVPVGKDGLPEILVLPRPPSGPLERVVGLLAATPAADDSGDAGALAARLFRGAGGGAVLRLLVPLLVGAGSGIEARMPYDLEFR